LVVAKAPRAYGDVVRLHRDNDEERAARLERLMEEFRAKRQRPAGNGTARAHPAKVTEAKKRLREEKIRK
jgi:hypothetical protein